MWEGIRMIKKGKHDKRFEQKNGMLMVHSDCFFFFRLMCFLVCFCLFLLLLLLFVSVERVDGNS